MDLNRFIVIACCLIDNWLKNQSKIVNGKIGGMKEFFTFPKRAKWCTLRGMNSTPVDGVL